VTRWLRWGGAFVLVALLGVACLSVFSRTDRNQRWEIALVTAYMLRQQLELYRQDNGDYPTHEQGLDALAHEPAAAPHPQRYPRDGYVSPKSLVDPWGNPFGYLRTTDDVLVYSDGADGLPGGTGEADRDLSNRDYPR
jgi:general secretion pathway protein G